MSYVNGFNEEQVGILKEAYEWQAEKDERKWMKTLRDASGKDLYSLLSLFEKRLDEVEYKLDTLPQKNKLSGYISHGMARTPYTSAVYKRRDGGIDHVELPGTDIEVSINVAYQSLEDSIASAQRLIAECRERIRQYEEILSSPFTGRREERPFKAILDLGDLIDENQKLVFANALIMKKGTIDLRQYNKTHASKILRNIDDCMRAASSGLSNAEKSAIMIVCKGQTFRWFSKGPKDGKEQDQARKSSTTRFVKDDDHIETWILRNPSGLKPVP